MSIEIEIKLEAQPQQIDLIKQWVTDNYAGQSRWHNKQLINTYYDTENRKLRELEIGLRVRRDGDHYIQSVKSAGRVVGGLFQRNESETAIQNANLDLTLVSDPYLMILLEEAQEDDGPVRPLFRTDFVRELCEISVEGTLIEVALDMGTIAHKENNLSICEVELELKEGSPQYLFDIGQQLIETFNLVLDSKSKAERGYKLSSRGKYTPHLKSLDVVQLTAKSAAEGSFETIAHTGLEHWQYYIKQIKNELTIDSVLQLHRALQFMQHMYAVFAPLIPRHALSSLRKDWREITKNLSKLLHVASEINWLNNGKMYGFNYSELQPFEEGLHQAFNTEGKRFVEYLQTSSYNLKLLNFSRWLYLKEWRVSLKDSAEQKLKKEIFPFAIRQLQHQMTDLQRHLGQKEFLDEKSYLLLLPKMYRTLDIGLFFGSLFDSRKRRAFRQNWVDLVANIELFQQLDYIRNLLKTANKSDKRLETTEQDILTALTDIRTLAFTQNPYWN